MPDPLDIITLEHAQKAINTTSYLEADVLALYVTAVSRLVDDLCGPVVQREVIDQFAGGSTIILLTTVPVASVTSVTEYWNTTPTVLSAEAWPTSTADDYYVGSYGLISRRTSGLDTRFASTRVVVEYVAGRYETTEDVDPKFRLAAQVILAELWRAEQGAGNASFGAPDFDMRPDGFAIPRRAKQLLSGELKPPVVA